MPTGANKFLKYGLLPTPFRADSGERRVFIDKSGGKPAAGFQACGNSFHTGTMPFGNASSLPSSTH